MIQTKEFSQINTIITIRVYYVLVGPILEYGSLIWDPYTVNGFLLVERFQQKF